MAFPKAPFQSIIADTTSKVFGVWQQWFDRVQFVLNAVTSSGRTVDRPTDNLYVGQQFFDTDLNQEVFWNGTAWFTSGNGSITIGSTTTGDPGTDASVVNVGTASNAILAFTIPAGVSGSPADYPYPNTGIPVSTGTAWTSSKNVPNGAIVGTTDAQTLSNKIISDDLTIQGNLGVGASPIYDVDVIGDINFTGTLRIAGNPGSSGQVPTSTGAGGMTWTAAGASALKYGSFYDTSTTQSASTTTDTYPVRLNTSPLSNGVSISNDSFGNPTKIVIANSGIYNIQYSIQFANNDTQLHDVNVWLRSNNETYVGDVIWSNSRYSITSSHGGTPGYTIAAINYVVYVSGGNFLQLVWQTTDLNVQMYSLAATGPTPHIPQTPCVIVTVTQAGI